MGGAKERQFGGLKTSNTGDRLASQKNCVAEQQQQGGGSLLSSSSGSAKLQIVQNRRLDALGLELGPQSVSKLAYVEIVT